MKDGMGEKHALTLQGCGQRVGALLCERRVGDVRCRGSRGKVPERVPYRFDYRRGGRLVTAHPDAALAVFRHDAAQIDSVCDRARENLRLPIADIDGDGIEEMSRRDRPAQRLQSRGQHRRALVDAARNFFQSLRPMIDRVHGGHDREQHLGGTDVRCRLLPPDMLLAGLQGEPIGRAPATIHRHSDQPAGERALMRRPCCDVGRMRPAIAHGHAEALGGADGDIGAELAGRSDQRERQGIGRHDRKRACRMQSRDRRPEVPDLAAASGILQQRSEYRVRIELAQRITRHDAPAQRLGAGADDRERLRVAVAIDEESLRLRARNAPRHGHGLGRGGRLVEQRRIGDLEPGEIRDHGLEVEQGFQAALADLGLIRRIGRVPRRIFQDVARDHGRRDRAVIALADHRDQHLVLARNRAQLLQSLALGEWRAEIERVALPDARAAPSPRSMPRGLWLRSPPASAADRGQTPRCGARQIHSLRARRPSSHLAPSLPPCLLDRHGRAWPGHPRFGRGAKTWMPGTSPGMTVCAHPISS